MNTAQKHEAIRLALAKIGYTVRSGITGRVIVPMVADATYRGAA